MMRNSPPIDQISYHLRLSDDTHIGITSSSMFEAEGGAPTFDGIPFTDIQRVLSGILNNYALSSF